MRKFSRYRWRFYYLKQDASLRRPCLKERAGETAVATKVLILEDDPLTALGMADVLNFAGFQVIGPARRVSEAIELAERACPRVAVVDINLAGRRDGIQGADILKRGGAEVVFLTGQFNRSTLARAASLKPAAFLSKPCEPRDLLAAVEEAAGPEHRSGAARWV
jgi:DNA-binding NarL/FixJ family response regulator